MDCLTFYRILSDSFLIIVSSILVWILVKKMSKRWITKQTDNDELSKFCIYCLDECIVSYCNIEFYIDKAFKKKKFDTYLKMKIDGNAQILFIIFPYKASKDFKSQRDDYTSQILKGETLLRIDLNKNSNFEINEYLEFDSVIEFKDYYEQIEFHIYYPLVVGKPYDQTKVISRIKDNKLEKVTYPKIEYFEIGISEKDINFRPDVYQSYPSPEIVRNNGLRWITGDNKPHTDMYAYFANNKLKSNIEKRGFIYGIFIAACLSILVSGLLDLIWNVILK